MKKWYLALILGAIALRLLVTPALRGQTVTPPPNNCLSCFSIAKARYDQCKLTCKSSFPAGTVQRTTCDLSCQTNYDL